MALVPLLIVCASEEGAEVWMISFGGFFSAVCLAVWFYLLAKERQHEFYGVSKTTLFLLILLVQVSCHYHSRRSSEVRRGAKQRRGWEEMMGGANGRSDWAEYRS